MLLEPGPIPVLNTSWYPTTYDTPDFADMVNAALSQVDTVFLSMDSLFDPAATFDGALTGDTILSDLDTVDQINGDNAHLAVTDPIANIDGFKADGDAALTAAIQVTPGEAFTPVPAKTQYGTEPATTATAIIQSVTIANLTNPGRAIFAAGDQFAVTVQMDMNTGHAFDYYQVQLYAIMTKDGVQQPNLSFPQTDHTGVAVATLTWQATDVGNWTMEVHAQPNTGGEVVAALVTWAVGAQQPTTPAPMPAAVKVTLMNWTSQNIADNRSGDTWQIFVSGPANADVFLWATYNGTPLSEVTLGQTDSFGNYTLAGKWADTEIGSWSEHYGVGRFQMLGNLNFTVAANTPR